MKNSRIDEMLSYIKERNRVSLEDLLSRFAVSMTTLRRDLREMENNGDIEKYYGGVCIKKHKALTPLSKRKQINSQGKAIIGELAAREVRDGDVIFLDSGSTVGMMPDFLGDLDEVTVITNNMLAISKLITMPKIQLITLSGVYNRDTYSFVGERVAEILRNYNLSKAFMGSSGIALNDVVTHSTALEAQVKRLAVSAASFTYLLVDHLKFDRVAPFTYASFDAIDTVITDEEPNADFMKLFKDHVVKVRIPDTSGNVD